MPAMHRDDLVLAYSVFFLLSPVTKENGTVKIFLDSQKWELNERLSEEDNLKKHMSASGEMPSSISLVGDKFDIVIMDGRLLHRSVYNSTNDVRNVFSFTLFDEKKYPGYKKKTK